MPAVSLAADLRLHVYPRWRSVVRLLAAATAVAVRVIVGLWIRGGGVCMGSGWTHPCWILTGCHDALLCGKGMQTKRHHQHPDHQVVVILIMRYTCRLKHGNQGIDPINPW